MVESNEDDVQVSLGPVSLLKKRMSSSKVGPMLKVDRERDISYFIKGLTLLRGDGGCPRIDI